MKIREADIQLADIVGGVHATAWKQTYMDIFPVEYLNADTPEKRADQFRKSCADKAIRNFLLYENKTAVGTVQVKCHKLGECELVSLYILAEYRGKGYGRQIITFLKKVFYDMNIYLWVLEENGKAQKFYEENGFACTGKSRRIKRGNYYTQLQYVYTAADDAFSYSPDCIWTD